MAATDAKIQALLAKLKALMPDVHIYNGSWLRTWDKSQKEVDATLILAELLELLYKKNVSLKVFDGSSAVSIFRDQSTRTRSSFASACALLGLSVLDMDETKSQVAHGETVRETAAMLSFMTEAIGIRDDLFIGEGHKYETEVAGTCEEMGKCGVLPQAPGVINLQCDEDHPTQAMADMRHLIDQFGGVENLKGKKIAMTWAYSPSYGKPLSVPQAIIALMTRYGMHVTLAHPEGYELLPQVLEVAEKNAAASGGKFEVVHSMTEAFKGADIVYPKSWGTQVLMKERIALLKQGGASAAAIKELDKKAIAESEKYQKDWECTEEKMKLTTNGQALYMHCLPADITDVSCKHGEVAATVFERYRTRTYKEAGHKPYVIASMIMLCRFPNTAELVEKLISRNAPRCFSK